MTRTERIGLGVTTGVALLLRLPGLTDRPLWLDEALSATIAVDHQPWLALATRDLHPPLWTGLLRVLTSLSHAEGLLRLPSLGASVATVPATFWAARAWRAPHAALPAAALAAVLPSMAMYGAEARPYALAALLVTISIGLAASPRPLLGALVGVLALATLYGAWPVVLLSSAVQARSHRGAFRWWPLAATVATAAALTVNLAAAQRAHEGSQLWRGALASSFWSPGTLLQWIPQAAAVPGWMMTARADWPTWIVGGVIWALLALAWRARRPDMLALLAFGPALAFLLAAGLTLHPFGPTRHMLVLVPGFLLFGLRAAGDSASWVGGLLVAASLCATPFAPGLPVQRVPEVLARLGATPVLADGSAAPAAVWYGPPTIVTLPWRRPERLGEALDRTAPAGEFWFLLTRTRSSAPAAVRAWADTQGRSVRGTVEAEGALALRISPDPDGDAAPSPADGWEHPPPP